MFCCVVGVGEGWGEAGLWGLRPGPPKRISAPSGKDSAARAHLAMRGRALACLRRQARPATERTPSLGKGEIKVRCSGSFLHAARANACRANAHMLSRAAHHGANATQIRIPAPPPRVVCVADHVSKMRAFAAQFTLHRHNIPVQSTENVQNATHYSSRP